jgi:hypothetical protein
VLKWSSYVLSLVAFSMDGVGPQVPTAMEDKLVVALHLVTGHSAPQARSVGMAVAANFTPMMGG